MRIAFYAPLKSPNHPVVSGDRQIARLLMLALTHAGHTVEVASELRAYLPEADFARLAALREEAAAEVERISALWQTGARPDLWFTYHPYYKSPDLLGPTLADRFDIPYVTAEASHSHRRAIGAWAASQADVLKSLERASVNFCFTRRDYQGLAQVMNERTLAMLPPFIETAPFRAVAAQDLTRLTTVAMMRAGDKLASYRILAEALGHLGDLPWTLSIVGSGPCREEVTRLFEHLPPTRIVWHGELAPADVAVVLASSGIYVWPGEGEAFGLSYLEAQAAGLPVVAQATAGVPEVVRHGETGLLTPHGDVEAYAAAIRSLLNNNEERARLAANARQMVITEHSLEAAAAHLGRVLAATGAIR